MLDFFLCGFFRLFLCRVLGDEVFLGIFPLLVGLSFSLVDLDRFLAMFLLLVSLQRDSFRGVSLILGFLVNLMEHYFKTILARVLIAG